MAEQPSNNINGGLIEPVQGRSKLSTRRLLEAAGELIAERGFEQASLAAIGERAGYSRGLVTARFGTKENLLHVLIDRITSGWIEAEVEPALQDLTGLDALLRYLETFIGQLERDPQALVVLWGLVFEAARSHSQLRERFEPFHQGVLASVMKFMVEGIDDGTIDPSLDPVVETRLFTATLRGLSYHWLIVRDDAETIALFHAFRDKVERTLRNPKRRRR